MNRGLLPFAAIIILGVAVYANTLHAPFELDEGLYLQQNPFVQGTGTVADVAAQDAEMAKTVVQRFVSYLTFRMNYRLHGWSVEGYHIVNIAIHIANALVLYLLLLRSLRSPVLQRSLLAGRAGATALVAALLFTAHPVQTEAVNYVMQRSVLIAAFFSLFTLYAYARWWESSSDGRRGAALWYSIAFLSMILAMKARENALPLPVVLLLYDLFFHSGDVRGRSARLAPLMLPVVIVPVTTLALMRSQGMPLTGMAAGGEILPVPDWWTYVLTEIRVVMTYYRLLLLPVGQNFFYDFPLRHWLDVPVLLSLAVHGGVLSAGVWLLRRSRAGDPGLLPVPFGIAWFYLFLAVESGLVPLPYPLHEYRLYLPAAGIFIAAASAGVFAFAGGGQAVLRRAGVAVAAVVLAAAATAAYQRNHLWGDAVRLWEDTVRKSPGRSEPHNNLGTQYLQQGRLAEAAEQFRTAVEIDPGNDPARQNLVIVSLKQGDYSAAAAVFWEGWGGTPQPRLISHHRRFGTLLEQEGFLPQAVREYEEAARLAPGDVDLRFELGALLTRLGDHRQAMRAYREVLRRVPGHVQARSNLGGVYVQLGRYEDARRELETVLRIAPDLETARYNLRLVRELLRERQATGRR